MEITHVSLASIYIYIILDARCYTQPGVREGALVMLGHSEGAVHGFVKTVKGASGQEGARVTSSFSWLLPSSP